MSVLGLIQVRVLASTILASTGAGTDPALTTEHVHSSGAFAFKTPADWVVHPVPGSDLLEASGGGAIVRFMRREGEIGYDTLHVDCMLEHLASPMEMQAGVEYEYDFLSGTVGNYRILDSAFIVHYDQPIAGEREWRQRNLTLVGGGQSLCVIAHVPRRLWKKNKSLRRTVDRVVKSVWFPPIAPPPTP